MIVCFLNKTVPSIFTLPRTTKYYVHTFIQCYEEEVKFIENINTFLDLKTAEDDFIELTLNTKFMEEFSKENFEKYFQV